MPSNICRTFLSGGKQTNEKHGHSCYICSSGTSRMAVSRHRHSLQERTVAFECLYRPQNGALQYSIWNLARGTVETDPVSVTPKSIHII